MKKALIITYYWPPSGGAGVQRWVKFVKYLREFGIEPIVFIPENPHYPVEDNSFIKDIPENLKIIKFPVWEPYDLYKRFMGMKKDAKVQHGFIQEKNTSNIKANISNWIRSNFFIPDARKFWIIPSIKYLTDFFADEKPDIIISTGPPHSTHLIACGLKKNLKIPWIADFRDPWTGIDFFDQLKLTGWARKEHFRLEKKVLSNADKVIAVGWNLGEELKSKGADQVEIITNGYDDSDFTTKGGAELKNSKFVLSHIGSLNIDRNPVILWKVLNSIISNNSDFAEKLVIRLIGKVDVKVIDSIREQRLENFLEKVDYLPHDQIPEQYKNSALLLLLLNNTPNIKGIVTGKLFEYIASGTPVLCIGSDDGDAARIINETVSGKAFDFNDESGIENFIIDQYQMFSNGNIQLKSGNINSYTRRNLTKKLSLIIYDLLNNLTRSISL